MSRKGILFILIATFMFSFKLLDVSKNKKDFIYVVPKIKNFEVLEKNRGEYALIPFNRGDEYKEIEKNNFLNGSIFYNVPNGKYLLKWKYKSEEEEIILEKDKDWEKVCLNLEGIKFSKVQKQFLNFLTLCLIGFNIYIYGNSKKRFTNGSRLKLIFFLLLLKMVLSLRVGFQKNYLTMLEFLTTKGVLYLLTFYLMEYVVPKKFKIFRGFIWTSLAIVYFGNVVTFLSIYSPQVYVYLIEEIPRFLETVRSINHIFGLTRIIFVISIFQFFIRRSKTKKKIAPSWIVIGLTYFVMEFFKEIFPNERKLYYFVELMEILYIYWFIVFYTFKIYTKNLMRAIRYSLGVTLSYISLFYFKNLTEPIMILITVIASDFYTNTIEKIMKSKNEQIEKIYNRLCLVRGVSNFERQMEREILKNIEVSAIKCKILIDPDEFNDYVIDLKNTNNLIINKDLLKIDGYDYGYRMEFNDNRYIGLILVKEAEYPLTIEEQNFLRDLSTKVSSIVSQVRMDFLYKELM